MKQRISRFIFWVFLCCTCLSGNTSPSPSQPEVLILLSAERDAYRSVVRSFQNTIGIQSKEFLIDETVEKGITFLKTLTPPPDLIVAIGNQALYACLQAKPSAPIIYAMVLNPWNSSTDVAGIPGISLNPDPSKMLETIRLMFPKRSKIGIPFDPKYSLRSVEEIERAASAYQISIVRISVSSPKDLPKAFKIRQKEMDLLWILPDASIASKSSIDFLLKMTLLSEIPMIGFNRTMLEWGMVMAFSIDYEAIGVQTGELGKAVLNHTAGVTGVFPPQKVDLLINLKVAHRMGLTIPPEALKAAQEIIP